MNLDDLRSTVGTMNASTRPREPSTARTSPIPSTANDQLLTSAQYRPLVIKYRNGAPVLLSDVANVIDGVEDAKLAAWDEQHTRRPCEYSAANPVQILLTW